MNISAFGTFVGGQRTDAGAISKKLLELIAAAAFKLPADNEDKMILQDLRLVLGANVTGSDILPEHLSVSKEKPVFTFSAQEWHWLARHPEDLWVRYVIYRYKFKIFPAEKKLTDFPTYLLIEPASMCNLRCPVCFQTDKKFARPEFMGLMDWELYTRLIDEASKEGCEAITFASRGEPTLNQKFGKMLRYASDTGILDIKINTNATILTEALAHDILSVGVSEMVFSVDAATKEVYEVTRVRGKFEKTLANIRRFQEIRAKHYPSAPTVTRIAGVKYREDQDVDQISAFWSEIVDEVVVKTATPRWDSYSNEKFNVETPCSKLWRQMYIWWDGIVNPCDFDYLSYLKLGNVKDRSIKEIWHGDKMNELRSAHLENRRDGMNPCDRCPLS